MKYVRTKDGVYEVKLEEKLPIGDDVFFTAIDNLHFYSYEICKQSDTIDELCDEFVVEYVDGSHVYYPIVVGTVVLQGMAKKKDVYGAIWIKGEHGEPILKSVTKPMNEKGEFELL